MINRVIYKMIYRWFTHTSSQKVLIDRDYSSSWYKKIFQKIKHFKYIKNTYLS